MAPRAVTAEAATLAARQAVKEICDSPTARVGISADRTSKFRCGIFRESSKKDIRHLSSSQGVAALLQMPAEMQTPRLLNFGRAPTTLQAFEQPTPRRPMTPRKEAYSDVDSQVPMAAYLTEQPSTVRLPNYALLSSREDSLTRSASRGVEVEVKPSMARRAAGASPRLRPVTPREGYSMLPAGRPSLGRRQIDHMRGRRVRIEHDGSVRARSEEPSSARSPSSASSRNPERHGRTWAELMVEAQVLELTSFAMLCCTACSPPLAQQCHCQLGLLFAVQPRLLLMATLPAGVREKKELLQAARKGKVEEGKQLIQSLVLAGFQGPGKDEGMDYCEKPFFRSALWEATWKNCEPIVKLLVEKGATVDFADYQGRTPLHEAAYYGHQNLVEFLLDKGHPIDAVDQNQQTPLFRAAEAGRYEIVELLVKRGAHTGMLDSHGASSQHLAAFHGCPDMATWLLYKGSWKNQFSIPMEVQLEPPTEPDSPASRTG
eukprot:s1146_g1.t1